MFEQSFTLIKNLRSGWKAFWYNTTANLFKLSLKDEYDPIENKEDYLIEDILPGTFIDEIWDKQGSKLEFDYVSLNEKRDASSNVKPKKKV